MNNIKRLLVLSAFSLCLAACNGNSSGGAYGSSGETSDTSEGKTHYDSVEGRGWDEELSLKMANALNGYVLPFIELTEVDTQDSEVEEYFFIVGASTPEAIAAYPDALLSDGFTLSEDSQYGNDYILVQADYSYWYVSLEAQDQYISISASYYRSLPTWPSEQILADEERTGISSLPEFAGAEAYIYCCYINSYTEAFEISVECYGKDVTEDSVTAYKATLTEEGYELDEFLAAFGYDIYVKDNVSVTADWYNGGLYIAASYTEESSEGETIPSETFPAEALAAFCEENAITAEIPSFAAKGGYEYISGYDEEGYIFFAVNGSFDTLEEAQAVETSYTAALREAGYTIDDTEYETYGIVAYSADGSAQLQYWADGGESPTFSLYVYTGEEEIPMGEETFDDAVPGETSVISFEDESFMVALSEELCVWNNGAFSFSVDQHQSSIIVGNEGGFFAPVRCYASQEISIYSEIDIEKIEFEFDGSKYGASALGASDLGAAKLEGNTLTLGVPGKKIDIVLAKQIRIKTITVTFAA